MNDEQKQAVTHREGPLLIVAGAGTGKTTVLTRRIAWLIEQGLAKPEQILALTFTDKAAGEMEERVDMLLPYGYVDLQISTFHAFCERILREHAVHAGVSQNFQVLTELDAWLLTRQHLDRFELEYFRPLGNPTKYLKSILQHFSRLKDFCITNEQYLAYASGAQADSDSAQADGKAEAQTQQLIELANAYQTYQQILLENDSLDFGDLILSTLTLLKNRSAVLNAVREKYKFVLVDEFQDTNKAQYELIRLLSQPLENLTVVGDDDQAIYKFRGASIENILRFQDDYPQAKQVVLTSNYRSTQNILDHAYGFIQANNPRRLEAQSAQGLSKALRSFSKVNGQIEHIHKATLDEEIRAVIEKISELKKLDANTLWSDFAILVRSNDAGADFANHFERHKIPFQFLALSGLYNKSVVVDLLSLLRVIDRPFDSPSMYRVLTFPTWPMTPYTISQLNHLSARKGKTLFESMQMAKSFSEIDPVQAQIIDDILFQLTALAQLAKNKPVSEVFAHAARDTKYVEAINRMDEQKQREAFSYLQQIHTRMKSFERRAQSPSLHAFLEEFQNERDAGEEGGLRADIEVGPDVVRVMTIHAAKGLEFRYVFVVNMVDRKFPTARRSDAIPIPSELLEKKEDSDESLFHLEEERRLFYVAMTRAKEGLFFTSADDCGGARKRKLSRFLDELGYKKPGVASKDVFDIGVEISPDASARDQQIDWQAYIPKQFSYSQLAAFKTCPLQYKYAHILRVPVIGRCTFSFGKTMHNALHKYFTAWLERIGKRQGGLFDGGQYEQAGLPVTVEELLEMYSQSWIDEWYPDDRTREAYRKKGAEQLKKYARTFEDRMPNPLSLEQGFTYKIGDVVLKGQIDRIDAFEDGVEIIDYKTGTPKQKLERGEKEQLWLYQLAARDILKLNPKKLSFVYLEDQSTLSFLGTDDELLTLQEEVVERARRIRESDFPPNPDWHCSYCDFKDICEFRK